MRIPGVLLLAVTALTLPLLPGAAFGAPQAGAHRVVAAARHPGRHPARHHRQEIFDRWGNQRGTGADSRRLPKAKPIPAGASAGAPRA